MNISEENMKKMDNRNCLSMKCCKSATECLILCRDFAIQGGFDMEETTKEDLIWRSKFHGCSAIEGRLPRLR